MYEDAPEAAEPEAQENEPGENQPTATIPKSLLAGKDFKPGDEIVLRIVSLHENEAVVEYAPAKPEAEAPEPVSAPAGMSGDAEMADMMG